MVYGGHNVLVQTYILKCTPLYHIIYHVGYVIVILFIAPPSDTC